MRPHHMTQLMPPPPQGPSGPVRLIRPVRPVTPMGPSVRMVFPDRVRIRRVTVLMRVMRE